MSFPAEPAPPTAIYKVFVPLATDTLPETKPPVEPAPPAPQRYAVKFFMFVVSKVCDEELEP